MISPRPPPFAAGTQGATDAVDDTPQRLPSSWTDLYGSGLLSLIVGHVALAIMIFFSSFEWVADCVLGRLTTSWTGYLLTFVLPPVLLLVLVRFGWHVCDVTARLVTARDDRPAESSCGVPLLPSSHAELYAVAAEVSRRVGAPEPDEIRITHDTACYAAEWRQFALRTRRRAVVGIGLPVLAVFSVAELRVLLAHELAHIGLGHTRSEVFLFRFRGTLHATLDRLSQAWWRRLDPLYWFCRGSSGLLALLVAPVLRQQELRADAASAAVCGGELAIHTLLKEWMLDRAFSATVAAASNDPLRHRAGWTVFHRFARDWREISRVARDHLERRLEEEERPSFWDSHPTVQRRVEAMRPFAGTMDSDTRPALGLLGGFDELARQLEPRAIGESTPADDRNA